MLASHGALEASKTIAIAADELEECIRVAGQGSLSLQQASMESGYSAEHLRRLVREGTIRNAGRFHAPAISRADLPVKPGHLPVSTSNSTLNRKQIAQSVVNSQQGAQS